MRDNAKDLNFLFELDKNSIVLDLGGYKGDWANEIYRRYGCNIFIFVVTNINVFLYYFLTIYSLV